jgi:hypothetical protein
LGGLAHDRNFAALMVSIGVVVLCLVSLAFGASDVCYGN